MPRYKWLWTISNFNIRKKVSNFQIPIIFNRTNHFFSKPFNYNSSFRQTDKFLFKLRLKLKIGSFLRTLSNHSRHENHENPYKWTFKWKISYRICSAMIPEAPRSRGEPFEIYRSNADKSTVSNLETIDSRPDFTWNAFSKHDVHIAERIARKTLADGLDGRLSARAEPCPRVTRHVRYVKPCNNIPSMARRRIATARGLSPAWGVARAYVAAMESSASRATGLNN